MFRKSMATLLAVFLPLAFSLQACGRKTDPLTTIGGGKMSDIQKTLCEAAGDKDTDGDGICDRQDDGTGLNGPLSGPDPKENQDANNNKIEDGKDHWAWLRSNAWTLIGTHFAAMVAGWTIRSAVDGQWPWKFSDANEVKPNITPVEPATTVEFSNWTGGKSDVFTGASGGEAYMAVLTRAEFDDGFKVGNYKAKEKLWVCTHAKVNPIENFTDKGGGKGSITIQLSLDPKYLIQGLGVPSGEYQDFDQLKTLCRNQEAAWFAFDDATTGKPQLITRPLTEVGFKPVDPLAVQPHVALARLFFEEVTRTGAKFRFIDPRNDNNYSTEIYPVTKLDPETKKLFEDCEDVKKFTGVTLADCRVKAFLGTVKETTPSGEIGADTENQSTMSKGDLQCT